MGGHLFKDGGVLPRHFNAGIIDKASNSGVMNGAILTTFDPADPANKAQTEELLAQIRAYAVTDAVKNVTCAFSLLSRYR